MRRHDPRSNADMFVTRLVRRDRWTGIVTLNAVRIQREGFLIRDLTMPNRDWSKYDSPAKGRFISDRRKREADELPSNVIRLLPAFVRRQAQ